MATNKGFNFHVLRSQLGQLDFDTCGGCKETIIRSTVKSTNKQEVFDPNPVGDPTAEPAYSVHSCRRKGQ